MTSGRVARRENNVKMNLTMMTLKKAKNSHRLNLFMSSVLLKAQAKLKNQQKNINIDRIQR
jgi:hypothetical protein